MVNRANPQPGPTQGSIPRAFPANSAHASSHCHGFTRTETDPRPAHPGADSRISLPTGSATGEASIRQRQTQPREVERGNLDLAYQWSQGRIGGAGWVTGLATSSGGGGRIYAQPMWAGHTGGMASRKNGNR